MKITLSLFLVVAFVIASSAQINTNSAWAAHFSQGSQTNQPPVFIQFPESGGAWTNAYTNRVVVAIDNRRVIAESFTVDGIPRTLPPNSPRFVFALDPGEFFTETYTGGRPCAAIRILNR